MPLLFYKVCACSAFLSIPLTSPSPSPQVDHELSVPAVTMILLSVLAMGLAVASDQLMAGGFSRQARAALVAAGPLGTVVTEAAVHGLASPIAFVAAICCSLAGVLLRITAAMPS